VAVVSAHPLGKDEYPSDNKVKGYTTVSGREIKVDRTSFARSFCTALIVAWSSSPVVVNTDLDWIP
jgi:hypothetical protein